MLAPPRPVVASTNPPYEARVRMSMTPDVLVLLIRLAKLETCLGEPPEVASGLVTEEEA